MVQVTKVETEIATPPADVLYIPLDKEIIVFVKLSCCKYPSKRTRGCGYMSSNEVELPVEG